MLPHRRDNESLNQPSWQRCSEPAEPGPGPAEIFLALLGCWGPACTACSAGAAEEGTAEAGAESQAGALVLRAGHKSLCPSHGVLKDLHVPWAAGKPEISVSSSLALPLCPPQPCSAPSPPLSSPDHPGLFWAAWLYLRQFSAFHCVFNFHFTEIHSHDHVFWLLPVSVLYFYCWSQR